MKEKIKEQFLASHKIAPHENPPEFIDYQTREGVDSQEKSDKMVWENKKKYKLTRQEAVAFTEYMGRLSLDLNDFREGKKVLDIGSGYGNFKSALKKIGCDTRNFIDFDDAEIWRKANVIGKGEELPFKDNTFDMVISSWTEPWVSDDSIDPTFKAKIIREMTRVIKKEGGVAKLTPLYRYRKDVMPDVKPDIMEKIYDNVIKEIQRLHKDNPEMKFKIDKVMEDKTDFYEVLEIKK